MDLDHLRSVLEPLIIELKSHTHEQLPEVGRQLGMTVPPYEHGTSKAHRIKTAFDDVPASALPALCNNYLQQFARKPSVRYRLEEILWSDADPGPEVPRKQRHEIARALAPDNLYLVAAEFDRLLDRLFVLEDETSVMAALFGADDQSLRRNIQRHIHRNLGDWTTYELFEKLDAFACCDPRFRLLLEGLASPSVRPDEDSQRAFVGRVNEVLRSCSAELRETGSDGGYPIFRVVSLHRGVVGSPKNLIFASASKPDLRFHDAIDNHIEIVTPEADVLVYERPISTSGLSWAELQDWWAEKNSIDEALKAKRSLYKRLRECLPANSPPQTLLFDAFFETFGLAIPNLPALLPEVWLHWDPKTARERGPLALTRQRMDFLLLLPHGVRVVLEVDGCQHYTDKDGLGSPSVYAEMVAADRDLRLAGYEVFHFGGAELQGNQGQRLAKDFFERLFKRHGIKLLEMPDRRSR